MSELGSAHHLFPRVPPHTCSVSGQGGSESQKKLCSRGQMVERGGGTSGVPMSLLWEGGGLQRGGRAKEEEAGETS